MIETVRRTAFMSPLRNFRFLAVAASVRDLQTSVTSNMGYITIPQTRNIISLSWELLKTRGRDSRS
jgi:hypothetical protein